MPPASPSLTLTITPPGGSPTDYTRYLAWSGADGSASITQNFGRQGDTATFPLVDEYPSGGPLNVVIKAESQIKLRDNNAGVTLFAGVVTKPNLIPDGPIRNEWDLECVDYTYYADNQIVSGTFIGQTTDAIVVSLTAQANCGVTAATIATGGFVAPGPQLASMVINPMTLSDAWRKLATLSGQVTPYGWYVDENLALHFYDATTAINSGVTFTTTPTAAGLGSYTEGHIGREQFTYEWDGTSIRNRILVQGATQTITVPTTGAPTDVFRGDGVSQAWPLRGALTGSPLLKVGGVATSVTVASGGAVGTGAWIAQQNAIGAWFLTAASPPGTGVVLQIWYDYDVPIIAQANDLASQALYNGPNGGVFAEFISDSSLTTTPMALARAQRQRTEYAFAVERTDFLVTEEFFGWVRAGETFQYINMFVPDSRNSYALGVSGTFLAIANSVSFGQGGYRTATITGVRL